LFSECEFRLPNVKIDGKTPLGNEAGVGMGTSTSMGTSMDMGTSMGMGTSMAWAWARACTGMGTSMGMGMGTPHPVLVLMPRAVPLLLAFSRIFAYLHLHLIVTHEKNLLSFYCPLLLFWLISTNN
jgi:hypothetical protein